MRSKTKKVKKALKVLRQMFFLIQGLIYRFISCFTYRLMFYDIKSDMKFFPDKKENMIETISQEGNGKSYINDAEMICAHKFNVFGLCELGNKIEWNRDFKSGFLWPATYFRCIKVASASNNSDIKVPWELSRFNHFITLGKAYWLTGDEKYSCEFQKQISDWIENNPIGFSVNWSCSMELAIRVINWISGYFFFKESKCISGEFWLIFFNSLLQHGCFITKHLENRSEYTNNHYIADLAGMIWLGLFFSKMPFGLPKTTCQAEAWLKAGIAGFRKEMSNQVNKDGTHYEASTYYHKFVTEMFLFTDIVCKRNGVVISEDFSFMLEKMCDFLSDVIKPDGMSPLIGDADDGHLLIFSEYFTQKAQDFRHILAVAGEYFGRDDFKKAISNKISKSYENGGYYFLRNERVYCLVRCGPLACRGTGGHSHNDQLSFILTIDGYDFFIDPGTYVYTADYAMRNLFRSTTVHNTLILEGLEQNDFEKDDLFSMKEQTFSQCMEFSSACFRGRHFGYCEKAGLIHERRLILLENGLALDDLLEGNPKAGINSYLNFTLHPNVEINIKGNVIELVNNSCSLSLSIKTDSEIRSEVGYVSTAYGVIEKTSRIIIENKEINTLFHVDICINH